MDMIVPVVDVQNDNFKELWPAMLLAIRTSCFIAVDTELSGLGNRKALLAECIEERYKAICHAARSRSILSLGIACYKTLDDKAADTYLVQVYNLTVLCSEEYIIEPQSVQFLVQHGFDFNKQYAQGVPYCKGNNKGGSDNQGVTVRALFTELLRARKPLVLHNGLIDMAFLYQCFYAHLPERLATFTADLSEMFPAGVYDTKYATEFQLRLTASYLEYAYKKCKLDTSRSVASGRPGPHVHVDFCQYAGQMSNYVDYRACPAMASPEGQPGNVCERFSAFGWCPHGSQCTSSHDIDLILHQDEKGTDDRRSRRKRKRDKKKGGQKAEGGSAVFDGAPENKMACIMEVDPQEEGPVDDVAAAAIQDRPATAESCQGPPDGMEENRESEDLSVSSTTPVVPSTTPVVPSTTPVVPTTTTPVVPSTTTTPDDETRNGVKMESVGPEGGNALGNGSCISPAADVKKKKPEGGGTHRAGFDAFMTGYIFAHATTLCKRGAGKEEEEKEGEKKTTTTQKGGSWLPECINKVYLSGKAAPLHIVKSTFSKSSKAHLHKMEMVWAKSAASALAERAQQGTV